jgi:hypothetical protein
MVLIIKIILENLIEVLKMDVEVMINIHLMLKKNIIKDIILRLNNLLLDLN